MLDECYQSYVAYTSSGFVENSTKKLTRNAK